MELPVIVDCLIFLSWSLHFLLKVFIAYFPAGLYFLFIFVLPDFSLFYIVYYFNICLLFISFYFFSCSNTTPVLYTFHIFFWRYFYLLACISSTLNFVILYFHICLLYFLVFLCLFFVFSISLYFYLFACSSSNRTVTFFASPQPSSPPQLFLRSSCKSVS